MIKTKNKQTLVLFAKENIKASIAVVEHDNQMILCELITEKSVHDCIKTEDIRKLPKIICDFQTVESIDSVIEILKRVRKNIENSNLTMSYCMLYTEKEVLDFTQAMISQYKCGNTNIEQLNLLKESLNNLK